MHFIFWILSSSRLLYTDTKQHLICCYVHSLTTNSETTKFLLTKYMRTIHISYTSHGQPKHSYMYCSNTANANLIHSCTHIISYTVHTHPIHHFYTSHPLFMHILYTVYLYTYHTRFIHIPYTVHTHSIHSSYTPKYVDRTYSIHICHISCSQFIVCYVQIFIHIP